MTILQLALGFSETKQPVADPMIELAGAGEKYWIGLTVSHSAV